jgi:hypothetical protein
VLRKVIELAGVDCLPDFSFGDEFPMVHSSIFSVT